MRRQSGNDGGEKTAMENPRLGIMVPAGWTQLSERDATMATGTVKWFNPTKGFGFIQPEDGSKDVFVHISAVEQAGRTTLNEGQRVEYELMPGRDGRSSAENLVVAE